jgi:glycosyltransferase involved in cell wall biosynthesis
MKILFLVPYPPRCSPSQRFRFEQYFGILKNAGHTIDVQSFLTHRGWNAIYSNKHIQRFLAIFFGFVRRLLVLPKAASADIIFIHRELTPVGPPVFEWIIAKVLRKKIIYDFDDAIWTTDNTSEGTFAGMIRWRSKVASICRWSYKVSCGNDFLCDYARQFNSRVVLNPTTIDTGYHLPKEKKTHSGVTIGWTGSHTTLKYLASLVPALERLEARFPEMQFVVIANSPAPFALKSMRFIRWNEASEIDDLGSIDIGVMPLPDDSWAKGKCGFKALQYMSLKIPAVVSPVGVNTKIVTHGVDGLIARTTEEWEQLLGTLITDASLRKQLGEAGQRKVIEHYSVSSNSSNFLALFDLSAMITNPTR